MRVRLTLIAAALAFLAFAGPHLGDRPFTGPVTGTASQLSAEPAPEPALPAIEGASVVRSAVFQTLPHAGWRRDLRPVFDSVVTLFPAEFAWHASARPLHFPLLI